MTSIAILDIGKTNKKLFLIDEHYRIVWERCACLEETVDEDGDACEDITLLTHWVYESVRELTRVPGYTVTALNFSTYGASLVYLDEEGKILTPLYSYLKSYPEELSERFYRDYGDASQLCSETASPALGSLNAGLQLYRLKYQQPALFGRLKYVLHLPQYISYLVTGKPLTDITSIGCHTMLWDFIKNDYHSWIGLEGLAEKLPPVFPGNNVLPAKVDGQSYLSGIGLHDSSAALIPYLASFTEPFVLISTGTWCITMNPFNSSPLTPDELAEDCLCYLTYDGRPVKAARLFAGYEHEQQVRRLAEYYQTPVNYYQQVVFDPVIFAQLQAVSTEVSRFEARSLDVFDTYEIAYHRLMMDIMDAQKHSSELVITGTTVKRIFVDGGFGKNTVYMHLLAAAFPQMEVYAASVSQATAVGAALAIHQHWNSQPLPADLVEMRHYSHGSIYI